MSTLPYQNFVATLALLSWPLVALWLYRTRPVGQATIITILGAYLLLPVLAYIKIAGVPQFDKTIIANLAALGCLFIAGHRLRLWVRFGLAELLLAVCIVSPFITSEMNPDPLFYPNLILPGETHYDALSASVYQALLLIPFVLGRQILRSGESALEMLYLLVLAGLLYSLPILFEVRMSPQLHVWIYGFFQHSWEQMFRDGGFRPVVFMQHPIWVASFTASAFMAACVLWRLQVRAVRFAPPAAITAYLGFILLMCKTLSAILYGAGGLVLIRFAKPRLQIMIAMVIASLAITYPLLRYVELVPTERLLSLADLVSAERAESLRVRFDNEERLLAHASRRIVFGWGRWGRHLLYDAVYGFETSIPDGLWVNTLGVFGLVGFLAQFGLLAFPIYRALVALRFAETPLDKSALAALSVILAFNMADLIPNSTLTPVTWLIAGMLLGRAEAVHAARKYQLAKFAPDIEKSFSEERRRPT